MIPELRDCKTPEELLIVLLQEIKFHNDGDTNEQEFALSVCYLAQKAEERLAQLKETK